MPSVLQAATSTMATKKQLAEAVAPTESEEAKTKSMAALMSLLRATMSEEKAAGGAAAIGGTGEEKVEWLRSQLIGKDAEFDTPFGRRALTYADQTASGRSLRYIEDYLVKEVLPFYGNTHTEDSHVGSKTTRLVHKAARYVKRRVGAGPGDALLFCGSGTTAAIKRLQEVMGVAVPSVELRARVAAQLRAEEQWVVFVGPYEHHSNLLSWRQSLADVVEIGAGSGADGDDGLVDLAALRRALASPEYANPHAGLLLGVQQRHRRAHRHPRHRTPPAPARRLRLLRLRRQVRVVLSRCLSTMYRIVVCIEV